MDIKQTLSNMGRKISEARLPYIGDGRQYNMPTYTLDYNAFKWVPTPISGPATWTLGFAGLGLADAPILFADNAIDTIANGLPNVYNWAVDEYNAGASKRALNNYINNEGKEAREKIQRRQNQAMQPVQYLGNQTFDRLNEQNLNAFRKLQVNASPAVITTNEGIAGNIAPASTQAVIANRMEEAKSKIIKALGDLAAGKQIATAEGKARAKALIDLYNKIK